jgi:hypothetical protein
MSSLYESVATIGDQYMMSVREHHLATINPSRTASSQEAREGMERKEGKGIEDKTSTCS